MATAVNASAGKKKHVVLSAKRMEKTRALKMARPKIKNATRPAVATSTGRPHQTTNERDRILVHLSFISYDNKEDSTTTKQCYAMLCYVMLPLE